MLCDEAWHLEQDPSVVLTPQQKNLFRRYRKEIAVLTSERVPLATKRRHLVRQSGGLFFLPIIGAIAAAAAKAAAVAAPIIAKVASVAAPLAGKAALLAKVGAAAAKTGMGAAKAALPGLAKAALPRIAKAAIVNAATSAFSNTVAAPTPAPIPQPEPPAPAPQEQPVEEVTVPAQPQQGKGWAHRGNVE